MGNNFQIKGNILSENGQLKLPNFQRSSLSVSDFLPSVSSEKDDTIIDSERL